MGACRPLRSCLRKRKLEKLSLLIKCLVVSGILLVLEGAFFIYIWGRSSTLTTEHLEALIPVESKKLTGQFGVVENATLLRTPVLPEGRSTLLHTSTPKLRCSLSHPHVLFFMRIPKCATTSFDTLLQSWSNFGSFKFIFNPGGGYNWAAKTVLKVVKEVRSRQQVVYARHFYYVNFEQYRLSNYTYVTLVREPVSRFFSSYLYYHFSSKPSIQHMLKPVYRNETLLQCITRRHNGCTHNLVTKYFCGHQPFCSNDSTQALAVAKENVRTKFAAVGILEEMDLTVKVFKKMLPSFLSRFRKEEMPVHNKNEHAMQLSKEEEEAILEANQADIELYEYSKELLKQLASCDVT